MDRRAGVGRGIKTALLGGSATAAFIGLRETEATSIEIVEARINPTHKRIDWG